jgi:hypothetical protein
MKPPEFHIKIQKREVQMPSGLTCGSPTVFSLNKSSIVKALFDSSALREGTAEQMINPKQNANNAIDKNRNFPLFASFHRSWIGLI